MKPGFFLVELLVYISLSSLFFVLLFQLTSYKHNNNKSLINVNSHRASASMALDLLTNDLRQSTSNPFYWRVRSNNTLIWRHDQNDIGWAQEGNKLYRIDGIYNSKTNTWVKKTKSLALLNVKRFHVEYGTSLKIIYITLEVILEKTTFILQKSIAPRNGLVAL